MATLLSELLFKPWTGEPGWPQSIGHKRVGHDEQLRIHMLAY